ncbi:MAG: hypothetical protein ABGZ23_05515, partial [Fuerstiella sp.]
QGRQEDQIQTAGNPGSSRSGGSGSAAVLRGSIFEAKFHDHSFGFRPERSCHQAVEKVLELGQQGYRYVLDADTHETAMHETQTKIDGGSLSIPFEASQAYGLTLPERPANPKCSRIVTFS